MLLFHSRHCILLDVLDWVLSYSYLRKEWRNSSIMSELLSNYYDAATPIGEAIIKWARPEGWIVSPTSVELTIASLEKYLQLTSTIVLVVALNRFWNCLTYSVSLRHICSCWHGNLHFTHDYLCENLVIARNFPTLDCDAFPPRSSGTISIQVLLQYYSSNAVLLHVHWGWCESLHSWIYNLLLQSIQSS